MEYIPPQKIPRKRNATFDILILANRESRTEKSGSPEPKHSTATHSNQSTTEIASTPHDSPIYYSHRNLTLNSLPEAGISEIIATPELREIKSDV
jgi:hypothetical protein